MSGKAKRGLLLVSIGGAIVLLVLGFVLRAQALDAVHDFIGSYYSARCLIHHEDPYDHANVLQRYQREHGPRKLDHPNTREIITRYLYPPTIFAITVPMATLPWKLAHLLWAIGSACSLIFAGFLALELCPRESTMVGAVLIAYLLATSYVLVVLSNPSELAIGLCVTAAWSFIRNRWVPAGIISLAASLAIKPQIAGLVWVYFLLAGGVFRKRALYTLFVLAGTTLPFVLWTWHVAPRWSTELRSNLAVFTVPGGLTDPGATAKTANDLINLQVIVSRIWDRPQIYNFISYVVSAALFIAWATATVKASTLHSSSALYGLAAIAPLSMLPVYHHVYDAKLLLLTVPAFTMLWGRRDRVARTALLSTGAAFFFVGDLSHHLVMQMALAPQSPFFRQGQHLSNSMIVCAAPAILLLNTGLYLYIYWTAMNPKTQIVELPAGAG